MGQTATAPARRATVKPSKRENKEAFLPTKFLPRFWKDCDARLSVIQNIRGRHHLLSEACGGNESPQRELLAQRIAFLAILIETWEINAAEGESFDVGRYTQAVNAFLGLIKTVGLDKRIKSAKDLRTYLEEKDRE
jgi:hypothetical protein